VSRDLLLFAVGWALVHSLWQCLLIGGALRAALALTRRAPAPVRYWLCCAALALMVGGMGLTASLAAASARASAGVAEVQAESRAGAVASAGTRARGPLADAPPLARLQPSVVALRGARAAWAEASHDLERAFPFLVAAWAVGVAVFSLRLGRAWLHVRRLVRERVAPPPAWLTATAERLQRRIRISRPVRLLASAVVEVPTLVGWLRPVVLLPASALTGLTPRQIELLILHELVHVRRHDPLVNLLQAAAEVALFYHPAAWWVSARIRVEREHCCDDAVAGLEGVRDYVEALATMEEVRVRRPILALAADGSPLLARVLRLVDGRPATASPASRLAVGGALLVAAALLLFPRGGGASAPVHTPLAARTPSPVTTWSSGCSGGDPASTLCPELVRAAGDALAARRDGGVVIVQEVATGAVLANSAAVTDLAETAAPGSVWKLVLAGIWWDQGLSEAAVRCTPLRVAGRTVRNSVPAKLAAGGGIHGMLVGSCNTAAVRMALALRDRLGADGFAREVTRIGFPVAGGAPGAGMRDEAFWARSSAASRLPASPRLPGVRLADADSSAWVGVGLGSDRVQVTPLHVSRFLQAIGNGGLMLAPTVERAAAAAPAAPRRVLGAETADRLQAAMLDVVRRGTARGADRALQGTPWHLGGKTGTSPHPGGESDGWFVGLAFDRTGAARYSVVVYLPRAGSGGGEPARLAARLAAQLPQIP